MVEGVHRQLRVAKGVDGVWLVWLGADLQGAPTTARGLPLVVFLVYVAVQDLALVPLPWLVVMWWVLWGG